MYSNKNKITVLNMSIVFGPLLLRTNNPLEIPQEDGLRGHTFGDKIKSIYIGTIGTMIDNYLQIFGLDEEVVVEERSDVQPNTLQDLMSSLKNKPTEEQGKPIDKLKNILNMTRTDEPQAPTSSRTGVTDSEHWNEMQNSWMKFVEEWKKKFRDEADARRLDQSRYEAEKLEWVQKKAQLQHELEAKDLQLEQHQIKLQSADHNLLMEKQQLQLELENKKTEIRDLKRKHEEEIRELKRQYLFAMKNASSSEAGSTTTTTTVNDNNNSRSNIMSRRFDERKSIIMESPRAEPTPPSPRAEPTPSVPSPREQEPAPETTPLNRSQSVSGQPVAPPQKPIVVEEENNAPKHICAKCTKEIVEEWVEANGNEYHKNCFACSNCQTPIAGPYANRNGNFWCKGCLEDQARQGKSRIVNPMEQNKQAVLDGLACAACYNPIEKGSTDKLKALGKTYHKKCFNCRKCGSDFANMKFFNLESEPVCASCKKKGVPV
jgi:hypothetical protein